MCWNAEVSLNTFLVSIFTLAFVYYNNEYTQYKIKEFKNKWVYIFLLLVFSVQLFEFFIWKNINNEYNSLFTKILFITVYLQPLASLMLLSNLKLRNILMTPYIIFAIPYFSNIITSNKIYSSVSKNGHLMWNNPIIVNGVKINKLLYSIFAFFILFSLFYERKPMYLFFGFITLAIFVYKEYGSSGSMWCWVINSISLVMLFHILFYLPFVEKGLC